tara:strand:+ start:316 stop:2319 length:2004 start_codon:yes stop_codon:yes gene_type:complete
LNKYSEINKFFLLLLIICYISCNNNSESETFESNKSLLLLQSLSHDSLSLLDKKNILNKISNKTSLIDNDSLKNIIFLEISYQYLKLNDSLNFLKANKEARKLAKTLEDSASIAATHWDLGSYYKSKNVNDSAYYHYYKGQKIYELTQNDFNSARLLLNMAMVQKNARDYTGSEITTTEAIKIFKSKNKNKQLFSAYNNLGIIFNELEEYDRAISYHEKALEYLEKTDLVRFVPMNLNNIGVVYENKGHYKSAEEKYGMALNYENLRHENPKLYAMVLDNLAYVKYKSQDTSHLPEMFYTSLSIRDSIKHNDGISINKLHLSEYFLSRKDTIKALKYGFEAMEVSKKMNNNRDYLSSLLLLSKADPINSSDYMSIHIKLNDSLQKEERAIRNKFARIRFETNQYISETEKLNQRILRISLISFVVLLILILLYLIKDQRSKNKFIKIKQYANQEIYNLILAQQRNFEEGREKEKQHISRELHDGVLGKLFGVRLSLDSLNDEEGQEVQAKRYEYIEEIQNIAEEIRLISHRLNEDSLIEVDFSVVLEELIKKQNHKIHLFVDSSVKWEEVGNEIKINLYRIIQEALNNIHKHAKATETKIELYKKGNILKLQIKDNGIGFNIDQVKNGIGLKNMKRRSQNINASFFMNSNLKGTLIEVLVNLNKVKG